MHAPVGFEPSIPASERLQIHSLDSTATGIGVVNINNTFKKSLPTCR